MSSYCYYTPYTTRYTTPSSSRSIPTSVFAWYHYVCVSSLYMHYIDVSTYVCTACRYICVCVLLCMCLRAVVYVCPCAAVYVPGNTICVCVLLYVSSLYMHAATRYYCILHMCPHNVLLNKCLDTATTLLLLQVHGNTLTAAAVTLNPKP